MSNKQGFTMVELLVVLVIVGILAAVATPIYLQNVQRSRAAEAIATMGLLRQAQRDYQLNSNNYFDTNGGSATPDTTNGQIQNGLPTSVTAATGAPSPLTAGANVNVGTAQYFSNSAFSVDSVNQSATGASALFTGPKSVNFIVTANGNNSRACSGAITNCAVKASEVANYRLEMDNSGRIFVSYDNGTTWSAY